MPTVLGMVTHSLYCLADVLFISFAEGGTGLAALNIAMPVFTIYSAIGLMLGVGGATTIAVCVGRDDSSGANRAFTLTVVVNLVFGVGAAVIGSVFLTPLARLLGADAVLLPYVRAYLLPIQASCFGYILSATLQVLVRGDGNPRLVMIATVSGNVLNVVLDYLFVVPMGMGVFGAALATALCPFVSLAILSLHFLTRRNHVVFTRCFAQLRLLARIVKNGFSAALLELSAGIVIVLFNKALLALGGQLYVAAYAVVTNIAYVAKGIFNGIAQAAQPVISVNYGARRFERAERAAGLSVRTALIFSTAVYALFLLFSHIVVLPFSHGDAALISLSAHALRIYAVSFLFTGANTMLMYYFQSVERAALSTCVSLLRGVVFVLFGLWVLPALFGVTGVWLVVTFAELAALAVTLPMYASIHKNFARSTVVTAAV
nr:MATE family efflux transporter [Feifania hominis]